MVMTACAACGLIQLREPPPTAAIVPRAPWINYNEPDAHLDDFVAHLLEDLLPGPDQSIALGLGPFEAPLLRRLSARGLVVKSPDLLAADVAPNGCFPYLETWQARLEPQTLGQLVTKQGRADIVSCRYLLEHCHDPIGALRALGQLLRPNGLLILEIPDSAKFLAARDYSFPWEEHVCYFTEHSFTALAEQAGYETVKLFRYPGSLEDALIGVFRRRNASPGERRQPILANPDLFSPYRAALVASRTFVQNRLAEIIGGAREGVALFGAGHQAIMFVNALHLRDSITMVADDDPNKRGYFPPGFATSIVASSDLLADKGVKLCLLAVSPMSERKVRDKLAPLEQRGVRLCSIYAGVEGSIFEGRRL
jgi:SAM-dependent methyltransferase